MSSNDFDVIDEEPLTLDDDWGDEDEDLSTRQLLEETYGSLDDLNDDEVETLSKGFEGDLLLVLNDTTDRVHQILIQQANPLERLRLLKTEGLPLDLCNAEIHTYDPFETVYSFYNCSMVGAPHSRERKVFVGNLSHYEQQDCINRMNPRPSVTDSKQFLIHMLDTVACGAYHSVTVDIPNIELVFKYPPFSVWRLLSPEAIVISQHLGFPIINQIFLEARPEMLDDFGGNFNQYVTTEQLNTLALREGINNPGRYTLKQLRDKIVENQTKQTFFTAVDRDKCEEKKDSLYTPLIDIPPDQLWGYGVRGSCSYHCFSTEELKDAFSSLKEFIDPLRRFSFPIQTVTRLVVLSKKRDPVLSNVITEVLLLLSDITKRNIPFIRILKTHSPSQEGKMRLFCCFN